LPAKRLTLAAEFEFDVEIFNDEALAFIFRAAVGVE
jgi:hypothetical protein